MLSKITEASNYLLSKTKQRPTIGIILGTGLGALAGEVNITDTINYSDIPNFPVSTVSGHEGNLLFGNIGNKQVVIMQGRFHYYEGYSMDEITLPIRVMKKLGVETLIISNASGGMNPAFKVGDIMFITDHINLFPESPLRGPNIDELGPRFPDMSEAYSKKLLEQARQIAQKLNINVQQGVYVGLSGPCFETPAEYRYLRIIGGDNVGMSTVPEVIVANHIGIKCFGISVITDLGVEGKIMEITHEEVKRAAAEAEPKMTAIVKELVEFI
jgi:purine-nucleoside phosphorylase